MTKTYRRRDRTWRECISLEEFQHIARETIGRDQPNKEADDWCKNLFGNVASPGVKDPLRRKQREEAILADLERVERGYRDGGDKNKDHNSKKRKRTINSCSALPNDRRPRHRESTYLENAGVVTEGSPLRVVVAQQRRPVSPVTPTRPRLSRNFPPFGSMTNVTATDSTTPPKSPLDGKDKNRHGFGDFGKKEESKSCLSGSPDIFLDRGRRVGLHLNSSTNPYPALPPSSPPRIISRRRQMDHQGDTKPHSFPSGLQANIGVHFTPEYTTPPAPQTNSEHCPQPASRGPLLNPLSNDPFACVPPPIDQPTVMEPEALSIGVKRKRKEEDVSFPSKKVNLPGPPPSVQKVLVPSRNLKPAEIWSPDETTVTIEVPHPTSDISKSKTRKGDMSVDAIKARLIRATSTLRVLPSEKLDSTVSDPTTTVDMYNSKLKRAEGRITSEKTLEGKVELLQKAGSSTSTFCIPAPFPPGTSGPGSSLTRPNNSDKIAAYHGADKFYSGRPPSATPRRPPKVFEPRGEDKKSSVNSLGEDTKQDFSTKELRKQKPEGSGLALGRFPSFILRPQQLLFTDTAIGTLMSTSVVWLARGIHDPEPTYRPSSLQLIPRMNEVSKLESLLIACGWHVKKAFTSKRGIDRGVVFVDYEEQTDVHPIIKTHWAAQQCESAYRLATQYQTPIERGMRPIWIMDAKVLKWERLWSMRCGDPLDTLEEFVLWKKA